MTELLGKLILHSSPAFWQIIRYILFGATLTFFATAGLALGGSILSVTAFLSDPKGTASFSRTLSQHLMEASLFNPCSLMLLILLPLLTAGLISTSLFHLTLKLGSNLWPGILLLAFSASILLLLYGLQTSSGHFSTAGRLLTGAGGTALLLLCYLMVIVQTGSYMNTELWRYSDRPLTFFPTWNNCARITLYLLLALAITGARLLQNARATEADGRIRNTARGITLAALLFLAPFVTADLYTLPVAALRRADYLLGGTALLLSWGAGMILIESFRRDHPRTGTVVLVLVLLSLTATVTLDDLGREQATTEKMALLQQVTAVEKQVAVPAPVEQKNALYAAGEAIYNRTCSACHRFDTRLVGPPYNNVIPKYRGKIEELKSFIRTPVQRNPGYPAMPKLGLKEEEINAVAYFLLEKTGGGQ
ncbi:MAG: c-type cytochrome [Deltaproteobacteria bacterium]|nr:c-type cytochrome [Deltaproteobacteria bacterium]